MSTLDRTLKATIVSTLALGALAGAAAASAAETRMEQCAGIVKAGANDCATSQNACHSHVTSDANAEAWIYLPAGTCARIVGARVVHVTDPSPGN